MHVYDSKSSITISSKVKDDSAFPFVDKEELEVEISQGQLIIRKKQKGQRRLK